ncbi:MAG TPA: OsmC family protein, partial [Gaiellaceae bacterium]|nr:OsmC family protein [Gaiellaceae bacterium]
RSVATSMELDVTGSVCAEGDLDFRGTLGVDRETAVGFTAIRLRFELESDASVEELEKLLERTERYCVVGQTLAGGVPLEFSWKRT